MLVSNDPLRNFELDIENPVGRGTLAKLQPSLYNPESPLLSGRQNACKTPNPLYLS